MLGSLTDPPARKAPLIKAFLQHICFKISSLIGKNPLLLLYFLNSSSSLWEITSSHLVILKLLESNVKYFLVTILLSVSNV